jgi:glycosyltransferase involved in cell wall biosynthesis
MKLKIFLKKLKIFFSQENLGKKRIFIPFPSHNSIGGPATFMANLKKYLDSNNYRYSEIYGGEKIIFFPISYDLEVLKKIKKRGGNIIQRLDGVYYPSQHGEDFSKMNEPMKTIYQSLANYVVYQSLYSKKQCFQMFGEKPAEQYSIIVNGVDKEIFYPNKEKKIAEKIIFTTVGAFRKKAMIEPIVKALDSFKGKLKFELNVVGPIQLPELETFLKRDYIVRQGEKSAVELADILRQSDVFIHSQLNDNCPNAVLEALSSGLPVVGFDSGAMSELCFFSKELLAPVSKEVFQKYEDFDYTKLADKIELAIKNYSKYRQLALANCHLYSMADCGKKYVDVFEKFVK